jgi:hypothetical protein
MTGAMSSVYDEDEASLPVPMHASRSGVLEQNTYCEHLAVANGADHHGFTVMVHLKAPALVTVALLDLVAVLDVSESMAGAKLAHVKCAMEFVIDRLGPHDCLSVAVFSGNAGQVIPLTRMTDDGKAAAKLAVEALEASTPASTNVRAGLDEAAKVLGGRRQWNDVASVILVSDSHDSFVVPEFFLRDSDWAMPRTPVHTFGLGSDLDAAAMHTISEATSGTFSFFEDHAVIQDALAHWIGGLYRLLQGCLSRDQSSHSLQRGSSTVRFGCVVGLSVFANPAMRKRRSCRNVA